MIMKLIRIMLQEQNWGIWLYLIYILSARFQLGFILRIEMPQLGSTRLGTFSAQLGSAREISARTVGSAILCYTSVFILWWSSNKQRFEHLSEFAFEMQDVSRFCFQSPYTYSVTLLKVVKSSREMQIHNMFGPIFYYICYY